MKRSVALFVVTALLAVASHVQAGEVSPARLSAMGLPGLKAMSDSEGAQVRGSGSGAGSTFRAIVIAIGTGPNLGYPVVNAVVAGGFSVARK